MANAGVPHVVIGFFKRHGRWESENAKDGYAKDDLYPSLPVTQSHTQLGI